MADQVSFKTRVLSTIIQCAKQYNAFYVEQNHLLVSDAFKKNPYYIIQAEKDNYLHLTGVSTSLSAREFFDKAMHTAVVLNFFMNFTPPNHYFPSGESLYHNPQRFSTAPVLFFRPRKEGVSSTLL